MADLDLATILADGEYLRRVGDTLDGGPGGSGVDAEGAVDAVAGALVDGTGIDIVYDDTAGTITVNSTGSAGTTILDGSGAPPTATGAVGNYWEDTANGVLYGPKRAGTVSGAVLSEPFDNLTAWTSIVPTWTTATGRNGTGARSDYNAALAYNLAAPAQTDTVTVGFAFRVTTLTISTSALVALRSDSGATEHVGVYFAGVPGHFDIKRGGTTTLATSAGGQLTAGGWAYIELQAKLHDTAGFATLRVNGTQIATFPTGDTRNAGTKTVFDQVRIGALSSGSGDNDFDDLYIKTAPGSTFTGDVALGTTATVIWPVSVRQLPRTIVPKASVSNIGVIGDAGCYLRFTGTNPTYTVPPNSSVAFPVGTQIDGTGTATAMTLVQGSGVTITRARTLVTVGAGSGWTLIKTGTDTWDAHGDCV